jgi:cell division protein FtsB
MSDDLQESGPSGWAWFQLGRMAAKADRSRAAAVSAVFAPRQPRQVDPAALQAQNQALANENAQLRQELADYKRNYQTLREWAEKASRDLRGLPPESS